MHGGHSSPPPVTRARRQGTPGKLRATSSGRGRPPVAAARAATVRLPTPRAAGSAFLRRGCAVNQEGARLVAGASGGERCSGVGVGVTMWRGISARRADRAPATCVSSLGAARGSVFRECWAGLHAVGMGGHAACPGLLAGLCPLCGIGGRGIWRGGVKVASVYQHLRRRPWPHAPVAKAGGLGGAPTALRCSQGAVPGPAPIWRRGDVSCY
jgi:hypothetical protein